MPGLQGENLVGIDKGAVAIDRANAVTITVGGQASIEFSCQHCFAQCMDMWLDGFRMDAAKSWIVCAANFFTWHAIAAKKFKQQSGGRSVHHIDCEAKFRISQPLPVDQLFDSVEVRRAGFQRVDQILPRW